MSDAVSGNLMTEPTLTSAVAAQRSQVSALESQLAPRKAAEAAELESLANEERLALQRTASSTTALSDSALAAAKLEQQRVALDQGLSRARRSWLRMGEPVMASLLLFFAIIAIGMAKAQQWETFAIELSGLVAGTALARARSKR